MKARVTFRDSVLCTLAICVVMAMVGNAQGFEIQVVSFDVPQCDQLIVPDVVDELGPAFAEFPPDEQIVFDPAQTLPEPNCSGVVGVGDSFEMTIINNTDRAFDEVWFVADSDNFWIGNFDGFVQDAPAMKIDRNGINRPLIFESITPDEVFEPGEAWNFRVYSWMGPNPMLGSAGHVGHDSIIDDFSTASIIARPAPPADTDGDGDPDSIDPDDDNDGIGDALDTEPLVANNLCTSRDGDDAALAGPIVADLTCAAKGTIDVQGTTEVMDPAGNLRVIAPNVGIQSGFKVFEARRLAVISADPLPSCDPVNPVALCGDGIRCQFPADPGQPPFCAGSAGTAGIGDGCADHSNCQAGSVCIFQSGGFPGSGDFRCAATCVVANPTNCNGFNGFERCVSLDPQQIIQGIEYGACIFLPP